MYPSGESGVLKPSEYYFYFPSQFALNNLFYIEHVGHYYLDKRYLISRSPYRMRFLLIFVLKGSMMAKIGNDTRDYIFGEGKIAVLDCRCTHLYCAQNDAEMLWMHFDGNCAEEILSRIWKYGQVHSPVDAYCMEKNFRDIYKSLHEGSPLHELVISRMLHEILTDICISAETACKDAVSPIPNIVAYIHRNYYESLPLEKLASMVHMNACYFSQLFKKEIGTPPHEYILKTRLNAARALLKKDNRSVKQISYEVGFENDAYFSTMFRKRFKLTPTEFRNRTNSNENVY